MKVTSDNSDQKQGQRVLNQPILLVVFCFVLVVAPGCVGRRTFELTNSPTDRPDQVAQAALPVEEAVADQIIETNQQVLSRPIDGVGVSVGQSNGLSQIVIETNSSTPDFKVARYDSPDRIIVDLPSDKMTGSKNLVISDTAYMTNLRVGSHPGKSRLVFDLKNSAGVTHRADVKDGHLVITLSSSQLASTVEAPAVSEKELLLAALPPVDSNVDEIPVVSGPDSRVASNKDSSAISDLRLEDGKSGSQMVVMNVSGNPEYSIKKTAPSEYVLSIKNTNLSSETEATALMARVESRGIRTVRAANEEGTVQIRVFAQPDTFLSARRSGEKLIIEETTDLARVTDDMDLRAQLDPKLSEKQASKNEEKKSEPAQSVATKKEVTVSAFKNDEISDTDVSSLLDDSSKYTGRLISLDLQETDIDNALRIIAEVSNLNIVASDDVAGKVTLRLTDVPWDQALDVILKTNGLDRVIEGNVMRIAPVDKLRQERESLKQAQQAEEELEPLSVKYLRVSYAKASELKALVETILSERGTVAFDERSNQLIVKDVKNGIKNVVELVNKIDLRTPQVLLETQIVEATRSLGRELGAELGFQYIQSPLTGNGTGLNFPAAVTIGGSAIAGSPGILGSSFPTSGSAANSSAVTALFDSADGTKSLQLRLSALETEGRVRIISRPAVATTNNKTAQIKSVEKVRVRLPNGGLSVATGSGAAANGSGSIATEVIEAGIILDVTPQASPDYFVLLDIKAKSSSFSSRESGDGIPNEIERSASSTVLVSSGQTFALGGIYKISDTDRISGVPFLKDIPVLGHLFRRSVLDNSDEELLFFITPRIVEGSFDDASMRAAS